MKLYYSLITKDNIDLAIKIQNEIFPNEDSSELYKLSIEGTDIYPILKYYIVYDNEKKSQDNIVGVTGIYTYKGYPNDAWIGYYGVIESKRHKGFGCQMLKDFEDYAKKEGFKAIRLFTNKILFPDAFRLYIKYGFTYEKYTNFPKKLDDLIMNNEYVFSKSLVNEEVDKWDNKLIIDFELFH